MKSRGRFSTTPIARALPLHYGASGTDKTYLNVDALRADPGVRKRAEGMANSLYTYITGDHVDKVVQSAMQAGNTQLAEAYPKWIADQRVQTGVKHYANAMGKWKVGDIDGAIDSLGSAYNSRGYFDDGYSVNILKKNRDANTGNIDTVDVEFVNDRTGEKKSETVGVNDLLKTSSHFLAPPELVKHGMEQIQAQRQAQAELEKKRQERPS